MKKSEAVKLMNQMSEKLRRFADNNTGLTRSLTGSLAGLLPPVDIDGVLEYLQNNAPNIVTLQQYYDELISLAKEIDRLVAEGGVAALESADRLRGKFRYQANRFATTLCETTQELKSQQDTTLLKRITNCIFKKTWCLIGAIIVGVIVGVIVAVVVDILGDFGWLAKIKVFFIRLVN